MQCTRLGRTGLRVSRTCLGRTTCVRASRPGHPVDAVAAPSLKPRPEAAALQAPYPPHTVVGFE
jgi:aryl-alcohol dehydrogenase-like predicted oxidoreductase